MLLVFTIWMFAGALTLSYGIHKMGPIHEEGTPKKVIVSNTMMLCVLGPFLLFYIPRK
jgi:hypothetical protein